MLSVDRSDPVVDAIDAAIARLRSFSQQNIQNSWRGHIGDLPAEQAVVAETWTDWAIAPLNDRHHIAWDKGKRVLWLGQHIHIPHHLNGFPLNGLTLRLALTWWAEDAQIFVDGVRVHSGDLFDCFGRILLRESVTPGDTITVAIRLVSPGHDDGALVRSLCLYENPDQRLDPVPEPGFVADEMAVLRHYLHAFAGDRLPKLYRALQDIRWEAVSDKPTFKASLETLRETLLPLSPWLKQRRIHLLGHAHLDLAWLWPIAETWDAAQRTFESVLDLQQDFPDLVFTHSTPALYAWIEDHRPDLFDAIQSQVSQGTWEVGAGLWVEPEFNLVSGESIIRQVLYGQRYTRERFGHISRIAWLPDSFGFCWQLPQILRQGGIDYFATQKLRWNDTNPFPHDLFEWRSPDGTSIISFTLPPIGSDIDPVKMADYACQWETNTQCMDALWLPGVGDHGGGPTRDMITLAHRWGRSPFFPTLQFTTAQNFLDHIFSPPHSGIVAGQPSNVAPNPPSASTLFRQSPYDESSFPKRMQHPHPLPHPPTHSPTHLPTHADELYLELHRGCYTTHAEQKRWNRRCETLLYQAELFASIATLLTGVDYPKAAIEQTWKQVLFNQFHDILPGSSIPAVYDEVNSVWAEAEATAEAVLRNALGEIARYIILNPPFASPSVYPVIVFNPLSWERSELVTVSLPTDAKPGHIWAIFDHDRTSQPCQSISPESLVFRASPVPGVGYRVYWLNQIPVAEPPDTSLFTQDTIQATDWILENEYLSVAVNPNTGELDGLFDKAAQRQVLNGAGNQLQFFQDEGQYWDAWNIAPDYESHPLPAAKLVGIEWVERGALQQRLRIVKQFGKSRIQQDYVVQAESPVLRVETEVDWHEDYTLLKVAFPLNFAATTATYEMPCGAIERSVLPFCGESPNPSTPQERAKWEVPALNWADLGHRDYGVSILSDYKHGYDATPSRIRLTLLKSPKWPDPHADRGYHRFTYGIYPHQGLWTEAETMGLGYGFNQPLIQVSKQPQASHREGTLPAIAQFLSSPNKNMILTAFKPAEEDAGHWILRFYEGQGEPTQLALDTLFPMLEFFKQNLQFDKMTNVLEDPMAQSGENPIIPEKAVAIAPWKIITLRFKAQLNTQHLKLNTQYSTLNS